ncbi:Ras- protein Rab-4A [Tritrichomonas musculus]|uniref:Ras- protein Rab-4A n=1 Tax=Tritrichomonas musculus TaxID=1915356 RepID=A0ABR2KUB9_9EUKA
MLQKFDYIIKVIIVGESAVGKTSILRRFTKDTFTEEKRSTIGVDFNTKTLNTQKYKIQLQLWDTSGQEVYRSITSGYFKGAIGALFVFDLTKLETLQKLNSWLNDVMELAHPACIFALIGNKLDLVANKSNQDNQREIIKDNNDENTKEDSNECLNNESELSKIAQEFANENSMLYFEASAKTGQNVQNAFNALVDAIVKNLDDGLYDFSSTPDTVDFQNDQPHNHSSCCM